MFLVWGTLVFLHPMAVIDNFDSYNDGDLAGQGSWTGAQPDVDVQGSVVQGGTKALQKLASTGGHNPQRSVTASNVDGDQFSIYLRATIVNDGGGGSWGIYLYSGATVLFSIGISQDLNMIFVDGATSFLSLGTASVDTWYKLTIEVDYTNDRARAKVDAGSFSAYTNAYGSVAFSQVDTIRIRAGGNVGTLYWATIEFAAGSVPSLTFNVAFPERQGVKVLGW